jgi:hypothetical protein
MARDLTLAAAATAGALGLQVVRHLEAIRGYRAPPLPAFDAYVYVAMAEHPTVFTVAPWGHRILTPWLARAVPFAPLSVAFPVVTVGAFALACLLLYAFLRRRGHRPWAASIGVVAFALSPPVGELIAAPFLVEPLACALLIALLLALEMGLGVATLALIAVLGVLAKEVVLLFLPVVYFAARTDRGSRAARDAIVVGAAALAALLLLRVVWTPHLSTPLPDLGAERFRLLWTSVRFEPMRWLAVAAVGGLTLAAIAGALRASARPFLRRYAWVLAATLVQPLLAHYAIQQVVGEMNRYLLYAVPVLVALALLALDRFVPNLEPPPAPLAPGRRVSRIAAMGAALAIVVPLLLVDRYRRLDLQGRRDGNYILGFCHGTLTAARKLRDGAPVLLRMEERRFDPQRFEPEMYERMRWFLREGWGNAPEYVTDEALMQWDRATVVLPCYAPAPIEVTLAMSAARETAVRVSANGQRLGEGTIGTARTRLRFLVPAEVLLRGDNLVTLETSDAAATAPRLYALAYSPTPRSP